MSSVYKRNTIAIKERIDKVSPTICLAKWLWVSLHLPQGLTQSCYHPPTHKIPLSELEENKTALHNTPYKKEMRKEMLEGKRPKECSYCWKIEDTSDGSYFSDRYYRSGEWWAQDLLDDVLEKPWDYDINPTYVEVNFNQACNFKCCYCSPHLSSTWNREIDKYGEYQLLDKKGHNNTYWLEQLGLMPIKGDNPYVKAFWEWWPELYKTLRTFRMTGGEPLVDNNTFKILDYIEKHPNKNLELSITSNFCPPNQDIWKKFITKIENIINVEWKIIALHKYIPLEKFPICAEVDGDHYIIDDNNSILDDSVILDIFNGRLANAGSFADGKFFKFKGLVSYETFIKSYNHNDFNNLPAYKNALKIEDGVYLYTIKETYKRYVINKDFYRSKQINDLGLTDFEDISIDEAKRIGFTFDNELEWYNEPCVNLPNHSYTFSYNVVCPAIEHIMLFVSLDSVGDQLEYSRFGANYETIFNNICNYLEFNKCISISFINTFNLFSIYKLKDYLQLILDLRQKFNSEYQKIWFDLPILETPKWICINNSTDVEKQYIRDAIKFMEDNIETNFDQKHKGFKDYEIDKLKRNLEWIDEQKLTEYKLKRNKANFFLFFKEYDRRRKTNILKTFPELRNFYLEGKRIFNDWRKK